MKNILATLRVIILFLLFVSIFAVIFNCLGCSGYPYNVNPDDSVIKEVRNIYGDGCDDSISQVRDLYGESEQGSGESPIDFKAMMDKLSKILAEIREENRKDEETWDY